MTPNESPAILIDWFLAQPLAKILLEADGNKIQPYNMQSVRDFGTLGLKWNVSVKSLLRAQSSGFRDLLEEEVDRM